MNNNAFAFKFCEAFCLMLVITGVPQFFSVFGGWEYNIASSKVSSLIAIAIMLACSFVIARLWQKNKNNNLHKWLQGIIIFYVAYSISTYGFAKLMRTQFQPPQYILDTPAGELSGFWLTWVYYGHSQVLASIIGSMQVLGSIMLLFRKTRLIGIFILLPVMINIDLVNHFYDISPLAYYNAAQYTFILFFLLFLDYNKLKSIFYFNEFATVNRKVVLLNIARISVIMIAFLDIFFFKQGIEPKTNINGEWIVKSETRNGSLIKTTDYQDSVWSRVYFEWRYGCLFKYNANKNEDKDLYGDYKLNEKQHTIFTTLYTNDKPDSVLFHYQFLNDSLMNMYGRFKHDSLILQLQKIKVKQL